MRSLAEVVARNSMVTLLSKLLVKLITFIFTIWIIRSLGDADFGRYALIWSYVTIFATASDFGLGMYVIRELAKKQPNSQYLAGNVIIFRLILATATLLLILFSTRFTGYSAQLTGHILLAGTILLIYAVQDPLDSVLQAKERVDLSSLLRIAGQFVFVLLGIIFIRIGWGVTGLIIASLGNILISAVLAWHLIYRYLGGLQWRIRPALWPKLLVTALPFGLIGFALSWSQKIDTVILSLYWSEEMIGWYNAAYNLVLGLIIISNSFNIALYPSMSKENASDYINFDELHSRILKYLFMASLPLAAGLSLLSRPVILMFYGPHFAPAISSLMILAWVLPFIFISEFLRYMALVLNQERQVALAILSMAVGNVLLNFLFIPRYGLVAAATTTLLTEMCLVAIYLWQLRRQISPLSVGRIFWKPTLATGLMAGVLVSVSYIPVIPLMIISSLVYVGSLYFLGDIGVEEGHFIREMLNRVLPATSHQV